MLQNEKMRSDARSNRERILAVAREILAVDPAASLHAIAKTAGVGQGTLYRHFPTRETLVLAVYRDGIEALVKLAPSLLAAYSPVRAFWRWCEQFADYGRKKHGIANMVRATMTEQDFQETYWAMVGAVTQLMGACTEAGEITKPIEPEDFLQLLALLMHLPPNDEGTARGRRLLTLAFHGLGAATSEYPN